MLGSELAGTWVLGLMAASPSAAGGAAGLGQSQDVSPPSVPVPPPPRVLRRFGLHTGLLPRDSSA